MLSVVNAWLTSDVNNEIEPRQARCSIDDISSSNSNWVIFLLAWGHQTMRISLLISMRMRPQGDQVDQVGIEIDTTLNSECILCLIFILDWSREIEFVLPSMGDRLKDLHMGSIVYSAYFTTCPMRCLFCWQGYLSLMKASRIMPYLS